MQKGIGARDLDYPEFPGPGWVGEMWVPVRNHVVEPSLSLRMPGTGASSGDGRRTGQSLRHCHRPCVSWAGLRPSWTLTCTLLPELFKDPKSCLGCDGSSWTLPPGRKIHTRGDMVLRTLNACYYRMRNNLQTPRSGKAQRESWASEVSGFDFSWFPQT